MLAIALAIGACTFDSSGVTGTGQGADDGGIASVDGAPAADAGPVQVTTFTQGANGYQGCIDTFLSENSRNTAFASMDVVVWDLQEGIDQAGLIRFDNLFGSLPGQVAPMAEIMDARLRFTVIDGGLPPNGSLREVLVAFDATTTWNTFGGDPGVDASEFDANELDELPLFPGPGNANVTASVAAWAAGAPNLGWMLFPRSQDEIHVASCNSGFPSLRPSLRVTWRP